MYERERQTDRQTPHDDIGRAYASHRAAEIDTKKRGPAETHVSEWGEWSKH